MTDEEIKGDDIEESSTLISPKTTQVITEFSDVFPKDSTMVPSEVIHVNTEAVDVFHEDFLDKLPHMHDIQHAIDLVLGVNLSDLPHHRSTMHTELNGQIDELALEVKQQLCSFI